MQIDSQMSKLKIEASAKFSRSVSPTFSPANSTVGATRCLKQSQSDSAEHVLLNKVIDPATGTSSDLVLVESMEQDDQASPFTTCDYVIEGLEEEAKSFRSSRAFNPYQRKRITEQTKKLCLPKKAKTENHSKYHHSLTRSSEDPPPLAADRVEVFAMIFSPCLKDSRSNPFNLSYLEMLPEPALNNILSRLAPCDYQALRLSIHTLHDRLSDKQHEKILRLELKNQHPELIPLIERIFPGELTLLKFAKKWKFQNLNETIAKCVSLFYFIFGGRLSLDDDMFFALVKNNGLSSNDLPAVLFGKYIKNKKLSKATHSNESFLNSQLELFSEKAKQRVQQYRGSLVFFPKECLKAKPERAYFEVCEIAIQKNAFALGDVDESLWGDDPEGYADICKFSSTTKRKGFTICE